MRSSVPIPGNPWPHDMVLSVEDNPKALIDMLWVREAWGLQPDGDDLPPLLADQSVREHSESVDVSKRALWQSAWPSVWAACVDHAGRVSTEDLFTRLHQTANGSAERAELLRELLGPDWRDRFGDEAFDERYRAWTTGNFEALFRGHRRPLDEDPERVSLASLVPAWEAGLTRVVTVPCAGTHSRKIGPHTLLVTAETRENPERYAEALDGFR
ncbi:hypothetical protein [Subtercola boreus]|uniref:Uncharacterized protein n=1 Tax=Subtercola boreus TaxID=120213 RepID=A0A3E0WAE2_9MICO|nr:hypothetical protein [Subtercola boreus]RFA20586.1 hypothetical protein B7R24_09140 [Subtercola boreus]RFA20701.1 hypothetical protein B7R23_09075 [Subtercola boreus]RFA26911.1 hypothetical protein B7R25_09205 [Subtercola boreus]